MCFYQCLKLVLVAGQLYECFNGKKPNSKNAYCRVVNDSVNELITSITAFPDLIPVLTVSLISFLLQVKSSQVHSCGTWQRWSQPPHMPCLYLLPPQPESDGIFLITSAFLFLAVGKAATLISAASRPQVSARGEWMNSARLTFVMVWIALFCINRKA